MSVLKFSHPSYNYPEAACVTVGVCGECGVPIIVFEDEADEVIAVAHLKGGGDVDDVIEQLAQAKKHRH